MSDIVDRVLVLSKGILTFLQATAGSDKAPTVLAALCTAYVSLGRVAGLGPDAMREGLELGLEAFGLKPEINPDSPSDLN